MRYELRDKTVSRYGVGGGGFTLIELLVVISIIALLLSILLPSLNKARESAKAVACKSNFHQIALAIPMYLEEYKDTLPPYTNGFETDGTSALIDGVNYTRFRKLALIREWDNGGSTTAPRDGNGFFGPYLETRKDSKEMILGCPSLSAQGPKAIEVTWAGMVSQRNAYYYMSYGLNYEQVTNGYPEYGPLALTKVRRPSSLVYMCDTTGISPYVASWCIAEWADYSTVAPGARHNDKFNAVFVDGHVDGDTIENLFTPEYFVNQ